MTFFQKVLDVVKYILIVVALTVFIFVSFFAFINVSKNILNTTTEATTERSLIIYSGENEVYKYEGKCRYTLSESNNHITIYNEDDNIIYEAFLPEYPCVIVDYSLETVDEANEELSGDIQ